MFFGAISLINLSNNIGENKLRDEYIIVVYRQ